MSFDNVFNYEGQILKITTRIEHYKVLLAEINHQIVCFENYVGLCNIKTTKLTELLRLQTIYNTEITNNQFALDEITNIQFLDENNKQKLCTFFQYTTYNTSLYMNIIAHNLNEILLDPEFNELLNNTHNSNELKIIMGNTIIFKYKKNHYHTFFQ